MTAGFRFTLRRRPMIGIKTATLLALSALVFPAAASLRAEDRMRTGLWEVTGDCK